MSGPSAPERRDRGGAAAGHALVVGGSGMLRGACLELAARGQRVSVVARRPQSLRALAEAAKGRPGSIEPLPLDYRDEAELRRAVREAQGRHGPIEVAICWIHSTAPSAPVAIAEEIEAAHRSGHRPGLSPGCCRFFRVIGSVSRDPSLPDPDRSAPFSRYRAIEYHEVILGYHDSEPPRWLTNDEISEGVIGAVDGARLPHVVGTVTPWERRPQVR